MSTKKYLSIKLDKMIIKNYFDIDPNYNKKFNF